VGGHEADDRAVDLGDQDPRRRIGQHALEPRRDLRVRRGVAEVVEQHGDVVRVAGARIADEHGVAA
jgi:hypothetical protein